MLTPDPGVLASLYKVPEVDLAANLRAASAVGHTYRHVLGEAIKLQMGPGKLSVHEYFYYQLWNNSLTLEEKKQFVGRTRERYLHRVCNDEGARGAVDDKLRFHQAMLAAGLPVPQLVAIVHPSRQLAGTPALATVDAVQAFFTDRASYPIFGKPIDGVFSLGVFRADGYDEANGRLVMHDGTAPAVDDCAAQLAGYAQGYILQNVLLPDAGIAARFGDRLWSVRMVVFLTPGGPVVIRAVCKIPVGGNIADNFWRGNLVGAVDVASGEVVRTVRGTSTAMEIDLAHPNTGAQITGTVLPDWEAALAIAREGAAKLPGIRTQSWDIALTDRGPVILESNYGGDLNLAQLAWGKGMLDSDYRAHLGRNGFKT